MAGTLAAAGLLFGAALLTVASCVDPEAYMDAVSIVKIRLSLACLAALLCSYSTIALLKTVCVCAEPVL